MTAHKHSNGLTLKQETFAIEYVKNGGNATEAYASSYDAAKSSYQVLRNHGHRLLRNPVVMARIEELKAKAVARIDITLDKLTAKYECVIDKAMAKEQFASVVSAITGQAKLHGFLTDRADITTNGLAIAPKDITDLDAAKVLMFIASRKGKETDVERLHTGNGNGNKATVN